MSLRYLKDRGLWALVNLATGEVTATGGFHPLYAILTGR